MDTSRRQFLKSCAVAASAVPCAAALAGLCKSAGKAFAAEPAPDEPVQGRPGKVMEARFYEKRDDNRIECTLCTRHCSVGEGDRGYCRVRENRKGVYYTLVYGNPCSGLDGGMPDPIEKKPLFHFLPGTKAYSIATAGCNVQCLFCQNWQISQSRPDDTFNFELLPNAVIAKAREYKCPSVAFTYSEPTVFYEYMYDTAAAGRKQGIHSVMISNGHMEREPLSKLCDVLSGVKIDLKAFTEDFYRNIVKGRLKSVLATLKLLKEKGMWFEIVYLVIPTLNDKMEEIRAMSKWVKAELGPTVPVHFTAFFPTYKLRNLPNTPPKTVEAARDTAMDVGLKYVYVGNVWRAEGHPGESTYCHNCGKRIIHRTGFRVREIRMADGACEFCKTKIPGFWDAKSI